MQQGKKPNEAECGARPAGTQTNPNAPCILPAGHEGSHHTRGGHGWLPFLGEPGSSRTTSERDTTTYATTRACDVCESHLDLTTGTCCGVTERARIERIAMRVWDCDCTPEFPCGRCEFIAAIRGDDDA